MAAAPGDLLGRAAECERIDALLESAQLGRADRVAIVGEPGAGKSALLDWTAARADGMSVLRALGHEPERDIAFAGLLELVRPLLDGLGALPAPQRAALEGALALGPPRPGARFAVGAAVLGLLAAAAERQPLVILLDDVQWLDEPTRQAVAFAGRRLGADRVGMLAASRPGGLGSLAEARFDVLELSGLDEPDALALVSRGARRGVAPRVAERLLAAAQGNPLALVELPRLLAEDQLMGETPLPDALPVGPAIERSFAGSAAALPDETQLALTAAALGSDDVFELGAALALLGLTLEALSPAERAGLLRLDESHAVFRHPLVRSALVAATPGAVLRRVHAALADSLPPGERRARHRAASCVAQDESVAEELDAAAREALERRAPGSAVSLLARAAELSPDRADAARRLVSAAESAWIAGLATEATSLAEDALQRTVEPAVRMEALHLLGQIAHQTAPPRVAQERLLAAADLAEKHDPARAVPILADAVNSQFYSGDPVPALATARRLWKLANQDGGQDEFYASDSLGCALIWAGQAEEGAPLLRRALQLAEEGVLHDDPRHLAMTAEAAAWVEDHELAERLSERAIASAREQGAVAALPALLKFAAWADFDRGRLSAAYATASEAVALAEETGQVAQRCSCLGILLAVEAMTGREDAAHRHGRDALALTYELELPWHRAGYLRWLGLLELAGGRLERAVDRLEEARGCYEERGIRQVSESPTSDLIEALMRLHRPEEARTRLVQFAELVHEDGRPSALSLLRRCEGLVAADDGFEELFREAIELHPESSEPFGRARTRLCFGEHLRRTGRRREARVELEAALDTFESLGAEPWAARAHAELLASGLRLRRRGPEGRDELTPQELQVAIQVARGLSNREISQTLFLSPKTIEWHLTRIYRKLDLHARAELVERFADQVAAEPDHSN